VEDWASTLTARLQSSGSATAVAEDFSTSLGAGLRVHLQPFRESVLVSFTLPRALRGHLTVRDVAGRRVRTLLEGVTVR